jgi:chromosome segregation ATPase
LSQVADQRGRAERAETAAEQQLSDYESRVAELRQELVQRVELAKARQIDLERELTVRESTITDLRGQVAILEAKVRETLEERAEEIGKLATSITELVGKQQEMQTRVYELEPVADQVPMLQAAVEEKDATLSERERELGNVRDDIEAIASRPVTGPVFRLLTKGKLLR